VKEERMVELLVELHDGLARLGPGNTGSTLRALALCEHLPDAPDILDVGCGAGAQTLDLAAVTRGRITAVDLVPGFLAKLEAESGRRGLADRIRTCVADMGELPFADASFDLIWSEGAVYIVGFDRGLATWRSLLRPGGYLVVSEASWFRPSPPVELREFWAANYPAIRSVEDNLSAAVERGWQVAGHFPLPVSAWTEDYYGPLRERLPAFRAAHVDDRDAREVADMTAREISLMERFADWYGYEFYVLRRPD
jgi:SAM-dependent methyltransferase